MNRRISIILLSPGHTALQLHNLPIYSTLFLSTFLMPLFCGIILHHLLFFGRDMHSAYSSFIIQNQKGLQRVNSVKNFHSLPTIPIGNKHAAFSVRKANYPIDEAVVHYQPVTHVQPSSDAILLSSNKIESTDSVGPSPHMVSARAVKYGFRTMGRIRQDLDTEKANEWLHGTLRIRALHSGEFIKIHLLNEEGLFNPLGLTKLSHLMRCKRTTDEVPVDPKLARILVQLSSAYDRPLHLISGHRAINANGTSPTSQHVLGRAADIRVPGVPLNTLQRLSMKLGARGIGLYPTKKFLHIDVRESPRFFWVNSIDGEEIPLPVHPNSMVHRGNLFPQL